MKKLFCLLMSIALLAVNLDAIAERPDARTFDCSVFENMEGFSVDKFDKTWTVKLAATGEAGSLALLVAATGNLNGSLRLALITVVDGRLDIGQRIQFLMDGTVYSFDISAMKEIASGMGGIIFTEEKSEFLEMFAEADEISVRATNDGARIEDTFSGENLRAVQAMVQELLRQDAMACYDSEARELVRFVENERCQEMDVR